MRPDEPSHRSSRTAPGAAPRDRSRDGYNLVFLAVMVTVLNIWIAATLPLWSHQIQRDREKELIFRGLQYAEAIRVYLTRNGQYPTQLKQLIESDPRCIRQLWTNPMRDDGRWGLIQVGTGRGGPGQPVQNAGGGQTQPGGSPTGDGEAPGPDGTPPGTVLSADPERPGEVTNTVAIRGVYSPDGEEAIHKFLGKESIPEWKFTIELVSALRQGTPERPVANPRPFLVSQIGRPFPPGVVPPVAMPAPDGQGGERPPPDGSGHLGGQGRGRPGLMPQPGAGSGDDGRGGR